MDYQRIKNQTVSELKGKSQIYLASILAQMGIVETPENCTAYINANGGATIFVGQGFKKLSKADQIRTLIHEAYHLPQIAVKPFYDARQNTDAVMAKITTDQMREDFLEKKGSYLNWKNRCDNLGMDAEVNEYIEREFGKFDTGVVLPNNLPKWVESQDAAPKNGLEFGEYVQYAMDRKEPPKDEDGAGSGEPQPESPQSDLNPESWQGVLGPILDKATDKVMEHLEKSVTYDGADLKMFGASTGTDTLSLTRGKVPQKFIKELNHIRQKVRPRYESSERPGYSYGKLNRAFPNRDPRQGLLPGQITIDSKKSTKKIVVVLDSSGSCWNEANFKVGLAIANWYESRHMLAKMYCCDTELAAVSLDKKFKQVRGGGGTEFGKRHIDKICKDCGEDFDILYLTDEELDLSEANKCKTCHILKVV